MLKRFGINVNLDEARVLVASADHDRSNDLNLDEFLELIFTDNEALNVDLTKIPGFPLNIISFLYIIYFISNVRK